MRKTYLTSMMVIALLSVITLQAQNPGTLNSGFGSNGYQWYDQGDNDQESIAICVQPDGKVLVGGMNEHSPNKTDWFVNRYNTDGTLDNSFGGNGNYFNSFNDVDNIADITVLPNGKILVLGFTETPNNEWDIILLRLKSTGSIDASFGTNGYVQLDKSVSQTDISTSVLVSPNGKIYIAGYMIASGEAYFLAHRLNANGSLDQTFSADGTSFKKIKSGAAGGVLDATLLPDGSLVMAGYSDFNGAIQVALAKFKTNGYLDNSFDADGIKVFSVKPNSMSVAYGITAMPNGNLLLSGIIEVQNDNNQNGFLMMLESSGTVDASFGTNGVMIYDFSIGADDGLIRIERLANGKLLALGYTTKNTFRTPLLVQFDMNGNQDYANYGSGTGKLELDMSSKSEWVYGLAVDNNFAYTVGYYRANISNDKDLFISSSHLYNPVGIEEQPLTSANVNIFPNPVAADQPVSILLDHEVEGNVHISIHTINGQLIHESSLYKVSAEYKHELPAAGLKPGVYTIRIENNQRVGVQKLIVQ